ncbi:MAG: PQQ-dependent sugar dehydrogenase [Methylococcales bacterium]
MNLFRNRFGHLIRDLIFLAGSALLLWLGAKYWVGFNPVLGSAEPPDGVTLRERLKIAEGFELSLYTSKLPDARVLRATDSGHLLVSLPSQGKIMLLEADSDRDGKPDNRRTLIDGLKRPHGIDLFEGWLYIAESDAIGRIRLNPATGETSGNYETLVKNLPSGGNHWSRSLRFGPDGWMYVSVGSSCNACIEKDNRRASLLRYRPDGSGEEIFASGLRNTVGFAWQPATGALYGVDNGRDFLGDDFPPCELNRIEPGGFYGWPFVNGNHVPDPDYGKSRPDLNKTSRQPAFAFGAHTAPLGIAFLRCKQLPEPYRGAALVTLHGSWNRSTKAGYAVVSLHFDSQGRITQRPFITGFEKDDDVIGRPVDVIEGADGSIYISDDFNGSIYKVRSLKLSGF